MGREQQTETAQENPVSHAASPEFQAWWFSIPEHVRNTMQIRSAVAGFNAGRQAK